MGNKAAAKWVRLGERFSEIAGLDDDEGREELNAATARGGSLLKESIELGFISLGEQNNGFLDDHFECVQVQDKHLWQFAQQSLFMTLIGELTESVNPHGLKLGPRCTSVVVSRSSRNWRMRARNYSEVCFDIAEQMQPTRFQVAAEDEPHKPKVPRRLIKPLTEQVLRAIHGTGESWAGVDRVVQLMQRKFGVGSVGIVSGILKANEDLKAWSENRSVSPQLYGDIRSAVSPGVVTDEELRAVIIEEQSAAGHSEDDREAISEWLDSLSHDDLMEAAGLRS